MPVVIAGSTPEADRLARAFADSGERVAQSAELGKAEYFVAVRATDEESLAAGEAALAGGATYLQVFVRIMDRHLFTQLSPRWFDDTDGPRLDVFEPFDFAARSLVEEHGLRDADALAILGGGPLAEALLVHAVRERYWARPGERPPLEVTIVAEDASALAEELRGRHKVLDRLARVHTATNADEVPQRPGLATVSTADVDVDERVYTSALIRLGTREQLARAIHEGYLRRQRERGDSNEAAVEWHDLPEAFKDSNRRQADDVPRKLAQLGWSVEPAPLPEVDLEPPKLNAEEVERLAEAEHRRWASDQRAAPDHRSLVPWSDLPEDEREKDRDTVRDLPLRLAALGFRVVSRSGT